MSNHYRQAAVAPAPPSRQRRRDSQNHSPDGRDRPGQEHPAPEDSTKAERAPKTRQVYSSSQTTSLFNSFTSLSDTGKQFFINSPAFSTPRQIPPQMSPSLKREIISSSTSSQKPAPAILLIPASPRIAALWLSGAT